LSGLPRPWYEKLIEGASVQGRFGDLVDQDRFYSLIAGSDQFDLVTLEKNGIRNTLAASPPMGVSPRFGLSRKLKPCVTKARSDFSQAMSWSAPLRLLTRKTPISPRKFCWRISPLRLPRRMHCALCSILAN